MSNDYVIKRMTEQDLDYAVDWAAREGWNPGLHDAKCFYAADPSGFLLGLLNGKPIASLSAVKYGSHFGFLGLYIVEPEFRGQGYGKQLWDFAINYLQGCTIGLDGVVEQQTNYKKSGFALAYRNIRYQAWGGSQAISNPQVKKLSELSFERVKCYDRLFFPAERDAFLFNWIKQPQATALGLMSGNQLCAYGVLRVCGNGYKIGPLCADDAESADMLFNVLLAQVPEDEAVFLDIPEINPAALALAERYSMKKIFETARMYAGVAPELPMQKIFGVTTFELG
ncbi:MAG: GNAT family N-acetyltransferase [Methylococcaceae bacterium]